MSDKKNTTPNAFLYLVLAFLIMALIYAYKKNSDYNRLENAFKEEQVALQQEFDELIDDYKDLSIKKKDLSKRLVKEINKIIALKDSVKSLKSANFSLIRKYRRRVAYLERENRALFVKVDSLTTLNTVLKEETDVAKNKLAIRKEQTLVLAESNSKLYEKNQELAKKVAVAGVIKTSPISAIAMKERSSGKLTSTRRSSRTDAFKVNFKLLENKVSAPGKKKVYIQIVDKDKNVIAAKGTTELNNKQKMVYSDKLEAVYNNSSLDILSLILVNRDDINKGNYVIKAFVEGNLAGSTVVSLR